MSKFRWVSILPVSPSKAIDRPRSPVYRRQGRGRIAPTVDSPRRRAGIKSSTRRGLVQPTSKGWLNSTHGMQVVEADGDRRRLDGNALGNGALMPTGRAACCLLTPFLWLSGNTRRGD